MSELLPDRITTVKAVGIIIQADNTIEKKLFPARITHKTKAIEYDRAVVEGETVAFNSFSNTSNTIEKDGKEIIKLNVTNLNNSISKDDIDANVVKFGEGTCGVGKVDEVMEQALKGVGKIRLNHLATSKAEMYEGLTTHKVAGGYAGPDGNKDIIFEIPTANKTVLDGTTAGQKYWSNVASSTPLSNIVTAYNSMKVKPSYVIMNETTFSNFLSSAEVITSDVNPDKSQNFILNKDIKPASEAHYGGKIMQLGVVMDVYIEKQRKAPSNDPFMPTEFVVLAVGTGELHFGGIPVADEKGVHNIKAEWNADHVVIRDPAVNKVVVKTAPLHVLKIGEGYFSLRVEA